MSDPEVWTLDDALGDPEEPEDEMDDPRIAEVEWEALQCGEFGAGFRL